jgi:hypothetical protein
MKISELIEKLEGMKAIYGDTQIISKDDDGRDYEIRVETAYKDGKNVVDLHVVF